MEAIQLYQISPEQLQNRIEEGIKKQFNILSKNFTPKEPNTYLNRHQVAEMFGVHITTVSNWQRNGTLKPLGISGKVFFLRSEIEASLKPLNV